MKFRRSLILSYAAIAKSSRTSSAAAFTLHRHRLIRFHGPSSNKAAGWFSPSVVSTINTRLSVAASSSSASSSKTTNAGDTGITLPEFKSKESYMEYMKSVSTLPKGFATGSACGTFIPEEAPSMGSLPICATVIYLTEGETDSWAAVFTKNKFPGAPIKVGRSRLSSSTPLQALVINNKVSNVCSGGDGIGNAEYVCNSVAQALNLSGGAQSVLPSSTGVIGWKLPYKELAKEVIPKAVQNMQSVSVLDAAEAIMTTDRYPKVRSWTLRNGIRIVGIAKGAGMIEPNMATMLGYILTDATISKSKLQSMLTDITNKSFNSISVDGAESTSDTVVVIASNQIPMMSTTTTSESTEEDEELMNEFQNGLYQVCKGLSSDIVRNGEGTGHVLRVQITNYPGTDQEATNLGRFVTNSALFKCAIAGNDPNTGRLAGAIGSFLGRFGDEDVPTEHMTLTLGGRIIFAKGKFILEGDKVEKELSQHMHEAQMNEMIEYPEHQKFVDIGIDFGKECDGKGKAEVLGSDLTKEYVAINADYRS